MEALSPVSLIFADPVLFPYAQPYGLTLIRQKLLNEGIESQILLPFQHRDPTTFLSESLRATKPKIIGISFRNLDPAGFGHKEEPFSFLPLLRTITKTCHESSDALLILGGSGFSIDPYNILEATGAPLGFIGPSEQDFSTFCKRYLQLTPESHGDIETLVADIRSAITIQRSYDDQHKHRLPRNRLPKVLSTGAPYLLDPQAIDYAITTGATIPVRTKTGCSLRCSYCVVPFIENLLLRNIDEIIADLRALNDAGYGKRIFFADGEFNLPSESRAVELVDAIREEFGNKLRWKCYICPSQVSDRLVYKMADSGCTGAGITTDSFSDSVRSRMGKRCSASTAESAVRSFLASNIGTSFTILFGAPEETYKTVNKTCDVTRGLVEEGAHVAITVGLRVYPFTPLERQALKPQYIQFVEEWDEQRRPIIFCSPSPRIELSRTVTQKLSGLPRTHWTSPIFDEMADLHAHLAQAHSTAIEGDYVAALSMLDSNALRWPKEKRLSLLRARILRWAGRKNEALAVLRDIV